MNTIRKSLFCLAGALMLAQSAHGEGNAVADTARHLAPTSTITESQVTGLTADLAAKAPAFTNQAINTIFAGPAAGSPAAPGFRALVAADVPSLSSVYLPLAGGTMGGDVNLGTHTLFGDTASGGSLLLSSTSNATKGKISFGGGNYYFDQANGFLSLGRATAGRTIDAVGDQRLWSGPTFIEFASSLVSTSGAAVRINNGTSDLWSVNGLGQVTAVLYSGSGAGLTNLDGGNIATGTVAAARLAAIAESGVTNLVSDLALKSPLASPTFTGTPAAPTAAGGTNTTQIATTAFVLAAIPAAPTIDSLLPSQTSNSGKFLTTNGSASSWASVTEAVRVTFDNSGTVLGASGSTVYTVVPHAGTLNSYTVLADQSGSITITVKRSTYANFPTTTDLTGGANVVLTTAQKAQDTTLSGWTTAIAAGDVLEFAISGTPASVTRVTVILKYTRS